MTATEAMMNWEISACSCSFEAPTIQLKVCCRCRAIKPLSVVPEMILGKYVEALKRRIAEATCSAYDG